MIRLEPEKGIPGRILLMMSVVSGLMVANLYYSQPLLEEMKAALKANEIEANFITVITQIGYASGLLFVVPTADMFSRRKIVMSCMFFAIAMSTIIFFTTDIHVVWTASFVLGLCSVVPQIFIPVAGVFSLPENKSRNMGFVLSGLLAGILAARVVSGYLGGWLGWRTVYVVASVIMMAALLVTLKMLPQMESSFRGSYVSLMKTVKDIYCSHPRIRLYSLRAAFSFGSMLAIWSCMAFHLAEAPFYANSGKVGMLGLCGMAGAVAASGIGKYVPRFGISKISNLGTLFQFIAWGIAFLAGDSYLGMILAIILVDIGAQCHQLSNQCGCLAEVPDATNRANTIFMTSLFLGGSLGTFCAGVMWCHLGWTGVCIVGVAFACMSLIVSSMERKVL